MIEKKDYENGIKQFEALLVNAMINIECYKASIEAMKKKISEFPEEKEDEKMKNEIKDMLK